MISPGKAETLTERDIQLVIKARHKIVLPNVPWFHYWECDMLAVSKSGHFHEYEIKLSRSDFRADFKKFSKHQKLQDRQNCPTLFWYVCPDGLISPDEVPAYAGLMYVIGEGRTNLWLKVIKQAPRATNPIMLIDGDWEKLAYFALNRCWSAIKKIGVSA